MEQERLKKHLDFISNNYKGNLILGGDFNCTLEASETTKKSFRIATISKSLKRWIDSFHLIDTFKVKDDKSLLFSHKDHRFGTQTRIDKLFVVQDLQTKILNFSIVPCPFSDHDSLIMKLQIEFKPLILSTRIPSYITKIKEFRPWMLSELQLFLEINNTTEISRVMVWDSLKAYLFGKTLSWYKNKVREWESESLDLQTRLLTAKSKKKIRIVQKSKKK